VTAGNGRSVATITLGGNPKPLVSLEAERLTRVENPLDVCEVNDETNFFGSDGV
jgi:hypothetical protein